MLLISAYKATLWNLIFFFFKVKPVLSRFSRPNDTIDFSTFYHSDIWGDIGPNKASRGRWLLAVYGDVMTNVRIKGQTPTAKIAAE